MAEGYSQSFNQYANESMRQTSFLVNNWPKTAPVWPILLVRAGFYYKGEKMNVTCFSCGLETSVSDWTRNVHPQQMHFKLNPDCQFIRMVLKPEGGPQTFNDQKKWQGEMQNQQSNVVIETEKSQIESDGTAVLKHIDQPITTVIDFNRENDQSKTNPPQLVLDSTKYSVDSGIGESNRISQASDFSSTNLGSAISYDSASARDRSQDTLLISGSYANYQPPSSIAQNSRPPLNFASLPHNMEIESDNVETQGLQYKHPEKETIQSRVDTYGSWPHTAIQPVNYLAIAGFFYTNDHDIVRCFCCDLGLSEWDGNDDAWTEHARHSPNCWYLKRVKGQDYIDQIQLEWKKVYNPKFPNLIDESQRIQTFQKWPNRHRRPTPLDIAKAGFFYTGKGDECRCHYCDGGLQYWEENDVPWEQHAYFFPFCKFVIKMKGRGYINDVQVRLDARPPYVDTLIRESDEAEVAITRDDVRERKLKTILSKQEFLNLTHVGYSKKAIKLAAEEVFRDKGNFEFTPEDIANKILDMQDRGDELPNEDSDTEETERLKDPLPTAEEFMKKLEQEEPVGDALKVLEENKKLKSSMICWKCGQNQICMLFTPCGHRLTCENCSKSISHCLKCNKKVKKKYKTYLA